MTYVYIYLGIGIIVTIASYISYQNKEKDISEVVQDKLHELRNDGSFSFNTANIVGHLLAFVVGTIFWPVLLIKKIINR